MKKIIYIIFFISLNVTGQNFVPNSGFEQYINCPNSLDELNYCNYWNSFRETPDYYNTCSTSIDVTPPFCYPGYQFPHTGAAFAGLYSYTTLSANNREFIGSSLLPILMIGQKYFISFFINLGGQNHTSIASNKIGVKFSTVSYSFSNPAPINNSAHFYSNDIITDTVKWTRISGSFVADSAYTYIMIGNFFDDNNTDTLNIATIGNWWAYYYIDDVCVSPDSLFCENWMGVTEQNAENSIAAYPNPCSNTLTVNAGNSQGEQATITLYNITGKEMLNAITEENQYTFITEKLAKGLYLVKVEMDSGVYVTKITKD